MTRRHLVVIAPNLAYTFPVTILDGIKRLLEPGQQLTQHTAPTPEVAERRFSSALQHPPPLAVIGVCLHPGANAITALRAAGIPVVLVDERAEGASTVAVDNVRGGVDPELVVRESA